VLNAMGRLKPCSGSRDYDLKWDFVSRATGKKRLTWIAGWHVIIKKQESEIRSQEPEVRSIKVTDVM
jgi:hypothetical protein